MDSDSISELVVPPRIVNIDCPRKCGWFRAYTQRNEWMTKIVDHPLYGLLTEQELVNLEVTTHDCTETRNARIRNMNRRAKRVRQHTAA
jgi:hypothetical protein